MIGRERFELWFNATESISLEGERLVVAAENDFSVECLRKSFHKELSALARQEIGPHAQVVYSVKPGLFLAASQSDENTENQISFSANSADYGGNADSPAGGQISAHRAGQQTCYTHLAATDLSKGHLTANDQPAKNGFAAAPAGMSAAESPDDQPTAEDRDAVARELKRRWESLESFVIDDRNKVAATSANHIVQNIGEVTPLFISGPPGCGKTHLLEGVYQACRSRVRSGRVLYLTSAQYTTQFLEALHQRSMPMFRQRFQQLDVFLLDDLQFLDGKRATLVELIQTMDHLVRGGKQLVLSADRPLAEMQFLGSELITRISSGLICRLDYPASEARAEIIRQMAKRRGLKLNQQVVDLIAERIAGDVRHICGALNRLRAYQQAMNKPIDVANARDWLQDIFQTAGKLPSLQEIEDAVCQLFGLDQVSLRSDQKMRAVSQPRMLAMWLSRKYTRAALSEIGDFFGGRSHSTVVSAKNKVSKWVHDGQSVKTATGEVGIEDAIRRIETKLNVG